MVLAFFPPSLAMNHGFLIATLLAVATIAPSFGADLAIEHVNVIPMTSGSEMLPDATVLIRDGRIHSITRAIDATPSPNATRIDGRGKWLMPALADMHVHLENDRLLRLFTQEPNIPVGTVQTENALLPYIANGVLQIAVLTAMPETIAQRNEVESGRALGPHIALAAMIDGSPPVWPTGMTRVAANASDGRQAVRDAAAEGYEIIKAYEKLDLDTFLAICDEASKLELKVIGHLPQNGKGLTERFFVPGFGMVAHAEEIAQQTNPPAIDAILEYARWAKRSDTWLTSTLTADHRILEAMLQPETLRSRPEIRYLGPHMQRMALQNNPYLNDVTPQRIAYVQRVIDFNNKLIAAFAQEGIPIVAGTDALVPGIVPGFSLHDELAALANAGLSNRQVLESATRLPAEWLGTIDDRGTLTAGKRADLLLLEGNPLADIKNIRRISAVIVSGKLYSRSELNARLEALSASNNARPPCQSAATTSNTSSSSSRACRE
jgi:imidazolonepropionase-like amidohydrolase